MITGQRFGAGDHNGTRRSIAAGLVICGVLTVFCTIAGSLLCKKLLIWTNTPPEILDEAYSYLSIMFAGMGTLVFYNFIAGVLRALGDSRTPLIFLIIACIINIILDLLFILGFNWGVAGAG